MGALDKRIFSGVAIASALLFVVSAVMLLTNGGEVNADSGRTVLHIVAAPGVLAVVYSIALMRDHSSFVRTLSGILALITGMMFLAVLFVGNSAGTLLAAASIAAAATIVADMLALWVTRIYGAMYVAAVLAAVNIAMDVLCFIGSTQTTYYAIAFLAFGIWLALSAYVIGFVKVEPIMKTREVREDWVFKRADKPQAKNKKATKKAKRPKEKAEPKPTEKALEVPKEEPRDELKVEETKAEEPAPAATEERPTRSVRTVKLPKRDVPSEEVLRAEKHKERPKTETLEEPKVEPKSAIPNDFMKRLVFSQNVNKAKWEIPKEEPEVEEPALATAGEPKAEPEIPAEPMPELEQAVEVVDESVTENEGQPVEEVAEEVPAQEPEAMEIVEEEPVEEPVAKESADVGEITLEPEIPVEELTAEPEPVEEVIEDPATEEVAEESVEGIPAGESAEPEPVIEVPAGETPVEEPIKVDEKSETIMEGSAEEPETVEEVHGPVTEDEEQLAEEVAEEAPEETLPKPEPVPGPVAASEIDIGTSTLLESTQGEMKEDIYTDYSPEAVVRRAAWNKGLRCRRGYGEHNIPVAFVKGKVAVYVDSTEVDTSMDAQLIEEGWTVLRYDAATITDGKAQSEQIATAVKVNMRSAKAAAKKKSKK